MLGLYVFNFIVIIFSDGVYLCLMIYFFVREKLARHYYLLPKFTSYLLPNYLLPNPSSLISSSPSRNIKQEPCRKRTFC